MPRLWRLASWVLAGWLASSAAGAADPARTECFSPPAPILSPAPIGGANGVRIGPDGALYVGAVMSQSLFRMDLKTNRIDQVASGPAAGADDLVFLRDGTLVWTAFMEGALMARGRDGRTRVLIDDLPGIDGIAVRDDGTLFVSQCFVADALWEVRLSPGVTKRKIAENLGCLNGFDFGKDGKIYGPSWFRGQIVRLDPDTGTVSTIIDGLNKPAAVKFAPDGHLYSVIAGDGRVVRIDVAKRRLDLIAQLPSGLDNLVPRGRRGLIVTSLADAFIMSVDIATGAVTPLIRSPLVAPGGVAVEKRAAGDRLLIADVSTLKALDLRTGATGLIGKDRLSGAALIESPLSVTTGRTRAYIASFTGTVQWINLATGNLEGEIHGLAAPYGLAELPDGTLAVAEYAAGRIARIDPDSQTVLSPIAEGLDGPVDVLAVPDGRVLVSETRSGKILSVRTADGMSEPVASGLDAPEGLGRLADGRILVAEVGARRLLAIDPRQPDRTRVIASGLAIGLPGQKGMPGPFLPTGVAVAESAIYISSDTERTIFRIDHHVGSACEAP